MNNQHSDLDGFIKAFDNAASKKGGLDDKSDSLYNSKGRQAACDVYHNWYKAMLQNMAFHILGVNND